MIETPKASKASRELGGTLAGFAAYGIWGLFPLYWRQLSFVEPVQILAHRVFWAGLFCLVLLWSKGRFAEIRRLAKSGRTFGVLALSAIVVTFNWGMYIWAVNSGRIIESALGYYINPLLSVALGVLFFKEKADAWTRIAVGLASLGIIGAAAIYGSVPWVSILLATTFAFYGALKKNLGLEPLLGLTVETLIAAPFALLFLTLRQFQGSAGFIQQGFFTSLMLVLAGVVTAVPLLFFAQAANTISLQRMGFIQYVSPTGQLLLGMLVFGERPSPALMVAFAGVLGAVIIYIATRRKASD
ncbi:MAG: hypothetical protein FD137_1770 [Spirochaetes bacterium]|nr:MAG: hypothetical protein FD137_1770 [Spirochaetota bacterium]